MKSFCLFVFCFSFLGNKNCHNWNWLKFLFFDKTEQFFFSKLWNVDVVVFGPFCNFLFCLFPFFYFVAYIRTTFKLNKISRSKKTDWINFCVFFLSLFFFLSCQYPVDEPRSHRNHLDSAIDPQHNDTIKLADQQSQSVSGHPSTQRSGDIFTPVSTVTSMHNIWPTLKIGTWNIRGSNDVNKRNAIDDYLSACRYGIVALQETKLNCRTCDTKHFKWIMGMTDSNERTSRRLAFLVHVSYKTLVRKVHLISLNIMGIEIKH